MDISPPPASLPTRGHGAGQRDGCQCPKGIVACTHLDGRVVWLAEEDRCIQHADSRAESTGNRWTVLGPHVPKACSCLADHLTMPPPWFPTDSLAEAEVEYERRCALLRAGPR